MDIKWNYNHPAKPDHIVAYTGGYSIYRRATGYALFIESTRTLVGPIATIEECKELAERDKEADEFFEKNIKNKEL